jgi:hypothetical protein
MMNIDPPSTRASSDVDIHQPISISDDDNDIEAEIIQKANMKISKTCYVHFNKRLTPSAAENLEKKVWRSVVYAFYEERPKVIRKDNRKGVQTTYLQFTCLKCAKPYLRGTGTDSGSTGTMCKHVAAC